MKLFKHCEQRYSNCYKRMIDADYRSQVMYTRRIGSGIRSLDFWNYKQWKFVSGQWIFLWYYNNIRLIFAVWQGKHFINLKYKFQMLINLYISLKPWSYLVLLIHFAFTKSTKTNTPPSPNINETNVNIMYFAFSRSPSGFEFAYL